jgi:hypothetical protein
MKKIVLFLLFLLFVQPVFACNVEKIIDLQNGSEPRANKILYEYILGSLKMTPEQVKEFASIDIQSIKAYEFDLNTDGENEVIGICYSTLYWGTAGYHLFILQKNSSQYEDISLLIFEPQSEVIILKEKNNKFFNLSLKGSKGWQYVAKFTDDMYQWSHKR